MFDNNRACIHRHLSAFVEWIATQDAKEVTIRTQADEIRSSIKTKATADGLTIRSTPWSGSYKKRTGLRRHVQGKHPVEGQDVDLVFVVSPTTKDDEEITALLGRFNRYAKDSYPDVPRSTTKSSVRLSFVGTKLSYDLVPMLATDAVDEQILIRKGGERRRTSVQKHVEFVTRRTRTSNDLPGRVKFNECIRLFKWWREVLAEGDVDKYTTMLIELMCAAAFDKLGVEATYSSTLGRWFGYLAHIVKVRTPIYFSDYTPWASAPASAVWAVVDPVNKENNVADRLSTLDVDALADALAEARDAIQAAVSADEDDDESECLDELARVFGNPILNHNADKKDS